MDTSSCTTTVVRPAPCGWWAGPSRSDTSRRDRQFDVLGSRLHRPSTGIGFDRHYIHDVRNGGSEPATSVHAYSPPMPAMTYYRPGQREYTAERTEFRSDGAWES